MSVNALQLQELEEEFTPDPRFTINDLGGATWALRKLAAYEAKRKEIEAVALSEMERIQAWMESEINSKVQPGVDYFNQLLSDYHRRVLEKDPKQKTISTPYGRLKSTSHKESPALSDEAVLLNYLKANAAEFVKVVEKPAWGDFKKSLQIYQDGDKVVVVDQSGHVVPGVAVEPAHTTFKVEV